MNFKVEIYSNNDAVDDPDQLALVLELAAKTLRKNARRLPRTKPQDAYTRVLSPEGNIIGSYKIYPVDLPRGCC